MTMMDTELANMLRSSLARLLREDIDGPTLLHKLIDGGFLAVSLPEDVGGSGGDLEDAQLIIEAVGAAAALVPVSACLSAAEVLKRAGARQEIATLVDGHVWAVGGSSVVPAAGDAPVIAEQHRDGWRFRCCLTGRW